MEKWQPLLLMAGLTVLGVFPALVTHAQPGSYILGLFYGVGMCVITRGIWKSDLVQYKPEETRIRVAVMGIVLSALAISTLLFLATIVTPSWLYE
jgi:hypothetical protein